MKSTNLLALARAISGICLLAAGQAMAAEATLPRIGVSADEEAVEASPYRTGGDVQVVTREEIEDRHYLNVTDAIKRIPGVQVSSTGYRAIEYGSVFASEISINGDSSVVIMVDGRRLDNDANSFGNGQLSKSKVPLDVITNIKNIERIEIIKGTGGSAYGSDATGGVINIITRRGGNDHQGEADAALGSWGKYNFALSQSGSFADRKFRYFLSANEQHSDDTRYKDGFSGETLNFANTRFKEQGASANFSYAFSDNQELALNYSWTSGKSHYPITAPDSRYLDLLYQNNLPVGTVGGLAANVRPGYRNWFLYDAWLGSFDKPRSSDVDLKYTFHRDGDMESYVRAYRNYRRYRHIGYGGLFNIQFGNITQANVDSALRSAGNEKLEVVDGTDLQLAKRLGSHSLMTGWTYRESEYESHTVSSGARTYTNRDAITGYLQDRIAITDAWTFTPGARYSTYSEVKNTASNGVVTERGDSSKVTFAAYTNYETNLLGDLYASWAQIFRPKSNNDYANESTVERLFDERGNSLTLGLRKNFSNGTAVDINWAITDMSNAIARYSVWDPNVVNTGSPTGFGNFVVRSVNATQEKEAFNIGVDHRFNDNWAVKASYAYVMEEFAAKNAPLNPNDGNINNISSLINRFRPTNKYQADVMYEAGAWTLDAWAELSTGLRQSYFTDDRFLVLGFSGNYDLFESARVYLTVDNLTNEAYENRAHPIYGPGTYPQPARSFMVGFEQKF